MYSGSVESEFVSCNLVLFCKLASDLRTLKVWSLRKSRNFQKSGVAIVSSVNVAIALSMERNGTSNVLSFLA